MKKSEMKLNELFQVLKKSNHKKSPDTTGDFLMIFYLVEPEKVKCDSDMESI
jgi:hypothetical protein